MQAELTHVLQLSLQNPRAAARHLLDRHLPMSTIWLALALIAVVSAALTGLSMLIAPEQIEPGQIEPNILTMFKNPLQVAVLQALLMVVMALLVQGVGRMFAGSGSFPDALVLIAWTEALLSLVQLGQIVLVLVSPSLATALGLFGIVLFLWILSNFIAEMHGFASAGKVLLGIVATVLAVAFVMAVATVALVAMKG